MKPNEILGIDIGGTGIKGAVVDIKTGAFLTEKMRILTPKPATPKAVAKVFSDLVKAFDYQGSIGCGFPATIKKGTAQSASNIDKAWIGTNVETLLGNASGQKVVVANDADLAGLAEMTYGIGKAKKYQKGVVILITIGTGLGSALLHNGRLVPNTELGHLELNGIIAERYASNVVRKNEELSWKTWSKRLNQYFVALDKYFSPDAIILGGGGSKYFDKIEKYIKINAEVLP
ncbi:MAG TPA: ROK family protein, partial [Phaeodactylibacter sp.]|nr:ROK family protein [Phaeodactylibacter sp.]